MKTMKMSFFFTEEKSKILNFNVIFFNKNISITVADINRTFCISVVHTLPEGTVSQIYNLGPSLYFM